MCSGLSFRAVEKSSIAVSSYGLKCLAYLIHPFPHRSSQEMVVGAFGVDLKELGNVGQRLRPVKGRYAYRSVILFADVGRRPHVERLVVHGIGTELLRAEVDDCRIVRFLQGKVTRTCFWVFGSFNESSGRRSEKFISVAPSVE
jgi:hypothetical protein